MGNAALSRHLARMPICEPAIPAVQHGFAVLAPSMEVAIAVTNKVGPEYFLMHTNNSQDDGKAAKVAVRKVPCTRQSVFLPSLCNLFVDACQLKYVPFQHDASNHEACLFIIINGSSQ